MRLIEAEDERDRRFRAERRRQMRRLSRIQTDTRDEIVRQLRAAQAKIDAALARGASDYQRFQLPLLRASVRTALESFGERAGESAARGAGKAWHAGVDLVDEPLAAGGARISAILPSVDTRQLDAMRNFLTGKMRDVSLDLVNDVNATLAQVAIGTVNVGQAVDAITHALESGGRRRAQTIVRTELGRAYASAAQERMAQAAERLPGLKKQWRRSGKLRSRPAHDAADGQIRAVDEPFVIDGDELMYPRDPAAAPAQTINCGCLSLPHMERWTVSQPGRQPFSDREIALDRNKRLLASGLDAPVSTLRGKEGRENRARLIADLEARDQATSRAKIAALLSDAAFRAFLGGGELGDYPVALASDALRALLGSEARAVRLSRDTARKQAARHRDVAQADYVRVQDLLDGVAPSLDSPRTAIVQRVDGERGWRAVIKLTRAGDELYLASLHRIEPRHMRRRR